MNRINDEVIVYNVTTEEWILTKDKDDYMEKMRYLLSKSYNQANAKNGYQGAILNSEIGQSRWKKTDKIVIMDKKNIYYFSKNINEVKL